MIEAGRISSFRTSSGSGHTLKPDTTRSIPLLVELEALLPKVLGVVPECQVVRHLWFQCDGENRSDIPESLQEPSDSLPRLLRVQLPRVLLLRVHLLRLLRL